jgi:pyruvate dehydrogenase E2 component (dihydrolipoamide acetyltransferase)
MARDLVMPKLGLTMKEGTLVNWHVAHGASVEAGTVLFSLATEKVETDVEAAADGILCHLVEAGTVVSVGDLVGRILARGEELPTRMSFAPVGAPVLANGNTAAPPAANGHAAVGARVKVSPLARRMAVARGLELVSIRGTGPGGRIVAEDVRRAPAPRPVAGRTAPTRTALTPMRRVIAERMHASLREMAQLSIGMDVWMDEAVALRSDLATAWAPSSPPSYTDIVARAAVLALGEHPQLNASLDDDELVVHATVGLGIAVAVPAGLLVPVVARAEALTLRDLSAAVGRLAARCREGTLGPDELTGSTFTVTSLGSQGVDWFTPIINPPNVAILGVGRVRDAVGFDEELPVRRRALTLSLTFDHRVIDGAPAAEFLAAVKVNLETPLRLVS